MQKNDLNVGKIVKVSGPLIVAENMGDSKMYDVVRVSDKKLIGEIIELRGDKASIQVYEETSGLGPGENVYSTGYPLSVELAPGLIEGIYDGIQRPLEKLKEASGDRIQGVSISPLSTTIKNGVSCRRKSRRQSVVGRRYRHRKRKRNRYRENHGAFRRRRDD